MQSDEALQEQTAPAQDIDAETLAALLLALAQMDVLADWVRKLVVDSRHAINQSVTPRDPWEGYMELLDIYSTALVVEESGLNLRKDTEARFSDAALRVAMSQRKKTAQIH